MSGAVSWPGTFRASSDAVVETVSVAILETGLYIQRGNRGNVFWPAHAIIRNPPEFIRAGEWLRVEDAGFAETLRRGPARAGSGVTAPALAYLVAVAACVAGAIVGAAYLVFRLAPALATDLVPISWEERLGAATIAQMAPEASRCTDPELARAIRHMVQRLSPPDSPYEFHAVVSADPAMNAFATPGGWIVINRGLLRKTSRPEEAAGVLAHEMQHVLRRDATRGMVRQLSWRAALALLTGDTGPAAQILYTAGALRDLGYRREDEEAADREGLKLLRAARIDASGMMDMLALLERESRGAPEALVYLSTHPDTAARRAKIASLAEATSYTPDPLLPAVDWQEVSARCR
jgi:predicted Zn-dependent protease